MRAKLIGCLFLLGLLLFGCKEGAEQPQKLECQSCHSFVLDEHHNFTCTSCHNGEEPAPSKKAAHAGLIRSPAAPKYWLKKCGPCHQAKIKALTRTPHFTLTGEINPVLEVFGFEPVNSALDLPEPQKIETLRDLVYDLLRRRCLRCHLFYQGDNYPETQRGRGCAACHLIYGEGRLLSHKFVTPPPDRLCLHCHYGNRVGFDYYGMFEHDYPYPFRSPLIEGEPPPRPWGVEFHELNPDVHLKAGLGCTDCHPGQELMAGKAGPKCQKCHSRLSGPYHVPSVLSKARCSACHATWSFQDREYHLLLHFDPDWEEWGEFYVQGSSEVEEAIISFFKKGKAEAQMKDKFSGQIRAGIWFLGFKSRRFEEIPLGFDKKGKVSVLRPLLDLHLGMALEDEIPFDNVRPAAILKEPHRRFLPYSPHTIGPADYFRSQKVLRMIKNAKGGSQ